jgi:peptidoglycan hydrolase CwlO-like protein
MTTEELYDKIQNLYEYIKELEEKLEKLKVECCKNTNEIVRIWNYLS